MNDGYEDPVLVAVANTIADGLSIDWDSLIEEHPQLIDDLRELKVLQEVRAAKRSPRETEKRS